MNLVALILGLNNEFLFHIQVIHLLIICLFLFYFDCYNKNPFPAVAYILSQPANQYLFASFFFISRLHFIPARKSISFCLFLFYFDCYNKNPFPAVAYILSQPTNQYLFASFFFISIITTKTPFQPPLNLAPHVSYLIRDLY